MTESKSETASREHRANSPADVGDGAPRSSETDVVLIRGVTSNGKGLSVIRHRAGQLESGVVQPVVHGEPIHGELVSLKPRPECPIVCDVKVELAAPNSARLEAGASSDATASHGPARVASNAYRANWDRIWKRRVKAELPN